MTTIKEEIIKRKGNYNEIVKKRFYQGHKPFNDSLAYAGTYRMWKRQQ